MKWADWMPTKYSVLCEKQLTPNNYINPLRPDVPHFIILFCLTAEDFTRQGESAGAEWVNWPICPWVQLTH
jgi:hypothetical protein